MHRLRHSPTRLLLAISCSFLPLLLVTLSFAQETSLTAPPAAASAVSPVATEIPLQSLFYSDGELSKIQEAMRLYMRGGQNPNVDLTFLDENQYLDQANQQKQLSTQGRFYTYPQFFLESLVFHSDTDWAIWVNNQKIASDTQDEADNQLKVLHIDKDRVELEWIPRDMAQIMRTWQKWPNDEIRIDELNGAVYFTLKPNQTFSSYVLRVLEGKVLPVVVDSQQMTDNLSSSIENRVVAPAKGAGPAADNIAPAATAAVPAIHAPAVVTPSSDAPKTKPEEIIELFEQPQ